jgi:hypothetical protein
MAKNADRRKRRRVIALAIACLAVCAVIVGVVVAVVHSRRPEETATHDEREVPLGVEEAVIIRYSGPRLVARPYRRGASVNLRIAEEVQQGGSRVYDVRYVVSLPGEFDLMEYLTSADGTPPSDLPPFKVRGETSLTKDVETRIREIEDVGVHIWHWYYETLAGLGVFWALWLAGLVFIGRPKRPPKPAPPPPEPSLAELIARYLDALARGDLPVEDKARLEILLLKHWRERLSLRHDRMADSCRQIRGDATLGRAYEAVEGWLHDPSAGTGSAEIVKLVRPVAERAGR